MEDQTSKTATVTMAEISRQQHERFKVPAPIWQKGKPERAMSKVDQPQKASPLDRPDTFAQARATRRAKRLEERVERLQAQAEEVAARLVALRPAAAAAKEPDAVSPLDKPRTRKKDVRTVRAEAWTAFWGTVRAEAG